MRIHRGRRVKGAIGVVLAVMMVVTAVPAVNAADGGHTAGGGVGRRESWVTDKTEYDASFGGGGQTAGGGVGREAPHEDGEPYLLLDHIAANGDIWYKIMGLSLSNIVVPGSSIYDFTDTTSDNIDGTISGRVTNTWINYFCAWYNSGIGDVVLPQTGDYRVYAVTDRLDYYFSRDDITSGVFEFGFRPASGSTSRAFNLDLLGNYSIYSNVYKGKGNFFGTVGSKMSTMPSGYKEVGVSSNRIGTAYYSFRLYLVCTPTAVAQEQYTPSTRIGIAKGDVGVKNENGEYTVYENTQFVDESSKRIYDLENDTWISYDTYTYDYSTYTYTFTATTGDNYTIAYGDEYITYAVNQGGNTTTYNYYYMVADEETDPDPDPDPDPGGNPGGNNNNDGGGSSVWDKLGELLGSVVGGLLSVLSKVLEAVLDFFISAAGKVTAGLSSFVDLILKALTELPALASGFITFMSMMFPFLPEEFMVIITFGLALSVVAAVVKKFI